ncbi:MAG: hypothetical protein LBK59_02890, partial [Bifidobacteriaceae bacterium]|nr:hypothetical protein [Bifidobacteriaceae bacterium]
ESKAAILAGPDPSSGLLAELARIDAYGPMAAYIVRALRTRGDTARQFIESYYEPTADLLDAMVAAGTVRPPRDPEAMMKYLVMESMGLFLVYSILHPEQTEGAQITRGLMAEVGVAMFDVMTHGLFTDSSLLDTYAASVPPAPTTSSDEEPES